MIRIYETQNPYEFDLDENKIPVLTKKNIEFVEVLIRNDSNYRLSFNKQHSQSYVCKIGLLYENYKDADILTAAKEDILEIVTFIDKENSTHLSVSGKSKGDNKGREITADLISKTQNLWGRLRAGDPELVNEIAKAVKGRNNFSFASKFCAYMSLHALGQDNYSIYDSVIKNILPYYVFYYHDTARQYWKRIKGKNARNISTIKEEFKDKFNYQGYAILVGEVLGSVSAKVGVNITRKQFDNLLWYYFKGIDDRILDALACLPE